jgi:hypothetical protein
MVDAPGDLTLWAPGSDPSVVVEADANGDVPQRGDAVALVGESSRGVHVSLPGAAGEGVATLKRIPTEYDETVDYAAGDVIGESTALLRHYVDWFNPADAYDAAVNDQVVTDADGAIRAYDSAGGDTVDMITGRVWRTTRFADYTAGKVAVVRHR